MAAATAAEVSAASAAAAAGPVPQKVAAAKASGEQGALTRLPSSLSTETQQRARAVRAAFKRPAFWVMVFGWSLALSAGLANVVAMQSWGTYVSHVTGTTTSIGLHIEGYHKGRHDFIPLGEAIALLLSFLFGAYLCGLLIDKNQLNLGGKSLYGVALVGNGVLLALSVVPTPERKTLAACLAAVALGLQNAMCTSHFGAVIRTTHVTGTVTDIGSTLGRMSMIFLRKGCRRSRLNAVERAEVGVDAQKLLVLGPMWLSFLLGCIVGAYLHALMGVFAMFVPAGFTFSLGTAYMLFRQRFKRMLQAMMKERLSRDLEEVETSLSRTQGYLNELRKGNPQAAAASGIGPAGSHANPAIDLEDLELEVGHILDSVHQVEVDIEDLQSQEEASPFHRSEMSAATRGPQTV